MVNKFMAELSAGRGLSKKARNIQLFTIGMAGFLGAVVIVFGAFSVIRVYMQAATDNVTGFVSTIMRLPLAKVNGENIYYSDYLYDLKAIKKLSEFDKNSGGAAGQLTNEQMSDQVIWRLANNIFIGQLARSFGVTVTDEEVETTKNQMLSQFPSAPEAEKELMNRYGWTLKIYEQKVIRPFLLQQNLAKKLDTDLELHSNVKVLAEKILDEIKKGANFEEMAKKYGEDSTAEKGGDLGWFAKGDMVPQFEAAAFALDKGQLSQEVVESPFGYHIIRVEDKTTEKTKDSTGKEVETEKVRARHIVFLFPSLDSSLDKIIRSAQISWYVSKIHNPINESIK